MINFFKPKPKVKICPKGNAGICWNCIHQKEHSEYLCKKHNIDKKYCFPMKIECIDVENIKAIKVVLT